MLSVLRPFEPETPSPRLHSAYSMIRTALKLTSVLIALLLLGGVFLGARLRHGSPLRSEVLSVDGLQAPVELLYDSMGVPHIFAQSLEDLFFAQGFAHARDRLWQMEMFRRVLQGRLSEVFGETTLDADRFFRTIGLEEAARGGMPEEGEPIHRQMERYAQGVNAALETWDGPLPPEFVLLRFRPEPWHPFLSQGIEKIMAWDLSDYQTGLNLARAREVLGDSALAPLMPSYPDWGVTIVDGWAEEPGADPREETTLPSPTTQGATGDPGKASPSGRATPHLPPPLPKELLAQATLGKVALQYLELGSAVRASNSWVVGGQRSRSGKPLVANDMHLALNAPNIWYLVGLHAPGFEVVGMSIPGAPGVVAGHSKAVAWGFTNAMVDDSDFFIEKVNPDDPDQYLTPEGWVSFRTREEVIRVKGADPVTLPIRSTRHGPVITPVEQRAGGEVLSYQWVAHFPAKTFPALLAMGEATNAAEFLEALRDFENPHQNVVFADTAGSWGYWMAGRVPMRASLPPPHLPVPGWTGEHDWMGWVPFEEKPHVLEPGRGYVATANNAQGRDERARRVTDEGWFGPFRAQRISGLIEEEALHDAESLLAIQMDPGSAFVNRYVGYAVEAFRSAGLEDLADGLEEWDRRADLESTEATLFHSWWEALRGSLMRDLYGGGTGYFTSDVVMAALEGQVDLPSDFAEEAARAASHFADIPWGEVHTLTLNHPLSAVPVLGRLMRFGRSGMPRVGGPYSVNVAGFGGTEPPFEVTYGPSQRHVVDLADPDGSGGFVLPGGQSGYPANPHSFDQLELWQEGRLWLLPLGKALVQDRTVATVTLEPAQE